MNGGASLFIPEFIIVGVGDTGRLPLVVELGTKGATFGNILEINFAKGLTIVTVGAGVSVDGGADGSV